MNKRERKQKRRISSSSFFQTILLSECPEEHDDKCRISFKNNNNGRTMELCMCPCHSHAKPPAREPEPIVGIHLLWEKNIH
jgi:hypothetical protein